MEAAAPYVRVLVRVPEAYLIVRPYRTTRPALLVLDADGRRVDSILFSDDAKSIAARLREAQSGKPVERWLLAAKTDEQARKRLAGLPGVHGVAEVPEGVEVRAEAGALPPAALKDLTVLEPIAVAGAPADAPGVWRTTNGTALVPRLLVHPQSLRGTETDLESRLYELPGIPKGALGYRVSAAPLSVPGVLSVFPDVFGDRAVVVARRGKVDWKAVKKAFTDAGCEPG